MSGDFSLFASDSVAGVEENNETVSVPFVQPLSRDCSLAVLPRSLLPAHLNGLSNSSPVSSLMSL